MSKCQHASMSSRLLVQDKLKTYSFTSHKHRSAWQCLVAFVNRRFEREPYVSASCRIGVMAGGRPHRGQQVQHQRSDAGTGHENKMKKGKQIGRCRLWMQANAAGLITKETYARYHEAMRDESEKAKYTALAKAAALRQPCGAQDIGAEAPQQPPRQRRQRKWNAVSGELRRRRLLAKRGRRHWDVAAERIRAVQVLQNRWRQRWDRTIGELRAQHGQKRLAQKTVENTLIKRSRDAASSLPQATSLQRSAAAMCTVT